MPITTTALRAYTLSPRIIPRYVQKPRDCLRLVELLRVEVFADGEGEGLGRLLVNLVWLEGRVVWYNCGLV
jgi:hypothetical protein